MREKNCNNTVSKEDYTRIYDFAHCLGKTVSSAVAVLLEAALKQPSLLNEFVQLYIDNNLDNARKKQLEEVVTFINRHNPYEEKVSLLVSLILL